MLVFPESPRWLFDHHRCVYPIEIFGGPFVSNLSLQRGRGTHSAG
jgi:hypothetical protein